MLFKSLVIASASGSVGGLTASRNRGGPYFRARAVPVNPNSTFQQAVRGFMSQLNVLWSTVLTPTQRAEWDAYAAAVPLPNPLGDPRNVGGKGMYIRANIGRLQAGETRVDDGPANQTLAAMTNPDLNVATETGNELGIVFDNTDAWANEDGGMLLVYGSAAINDTRNFFQGPYRFAGVVLGNLALPPTSPVLIVNPFPIITDLITHARFRATTADGRVSSDFRDFKVGTA